MKKPFTVRVVSVLLAVILCTLSMSLTAGAVEEGYELIGEVSGGLFTDTGASSGTNEYIIEDVQSGKTGKITATVSSTDVPAYAAGTVTVTTVPAYQRVTGITNGSKYLFVFLNDGHYVMNNTETGSGTLGTVPATDSTTLQSTISGNFDSYLYTLTGSGSGYTVKSSAGTYLNIDSSALSLESSSDNLTFTSTSVSGEDCFKVSKDNGFWIFTDICYLFFNTTDNTVGSSNTVDYVYLYQKNGTTSTYEVSTANISALIAYASSLTPSYYTNWNTLGIDGLVTAAQDAVNAVSNPYSVQTGAQTAQNAVNTAAQALHNALAQLEPDTTQVLAEFRVVNDADYDGGSVSDPVKSGTNVSCTATASAGSRFCYWTKNGAWYSSSAAITVEDGENVYTAWFSEVQSDGSIIVPITWTRTDEQTTDSDGDGSFVVTGIDTYSDYTTYEEYGVTWNDIKNLTTTAHPIVWDLNKTGTDGDGDGVSYPYNQGKYTGFPSTKIAASWTDLDSTATDGWKKASARLFRGEFYWPEGYTTSDIIKMVSVNDADYAAIYDYINNYIANNPADTAFASAFQGGTVLPINDDMFIFIHSAEDDLTKMTETTDPGVLDYLTFFTGTTGKGVWTQNGNMNADWGKTVETRLGTAYSVRAFRDSYPNLASTSADNANVVSMNTTADIYANLRHTDGWYTVLNTSTLASRLGSVYGVDTSFPAGTLFYFDIYVLDNDGAGGMDKWELNFKKADRSVTVNYYYDTIADGNKLGSATITGKVTGDSITLTSGTSAAQLDYYYAAATAHAESDEIYLSGVQQGTVPYVVTAGENVINVLYIKVAKNALNFVSAGGRYTYDGTEKTASGISLYYDGVLVNPTGSNTWNVTAYGNTYTVTYTGGSSVTAKYVGTTVNDIDETLVRIRQNGTDVSGSFTTLYTEGTLQIVPANVAFIYDYGVTNDYTDTANIPSGSVFAVGGVYWKMLTGNGTETTPVTYTPAGIYKAGVDAESSALDINGDGTADMTVTFLPATTVYYEDTFITPGDEWSTDGTAAGSTVYPDGMYGYGKGYEDDTGYSDGTCLTTVASGEIASRTTASFTFTGTGFTVHGKTDSESGLLRIYVKNASTKTWVKVITVDALFVKDAYNGVPLATVSGLDYGTYEVTLKAYTAKEIYTKDPAATERGRIRIDGITVYEAIKKDGSGAATTALANLARDAYSRDGELNCEIFDIRDVYLSDKITAEIKAGSSYYINDVWVPNVFTSATVGSASADNGIAAFLIDKDASGSGYTVAEIVEFGPKNELYIKPEQSLTLVITGKTFDKLTAEISSPTGSEIAFSVNTVDYTVTSTVHMYYPAVTNTAGAEITVVITNNSAYVLSVSSVKITNVGSPASAADETSLDEVLIYAAAVNGFVTSGGIHGDVNANGAVDPADYLMIKRSILGTYTLTPVQSVAADANTDTEVNATDYLAVKRIFLGTYTAD